MMDLALKTHKESAFGWVLVAQRLLAVLRGAETGKAAAAADDVGLDTPPSHPARMRYLAPR